MTLVLNLLFKVILGVLGISIVVLIHEGGHYIAARLTGIKVKTFSIGFGKKLAGFHHGGTDYRISLIPLGGYCRFHGEQAFSHALEEGKSTPNYRDGDFYFSPPWIRIIVSAAGPLANILFAILVFTAIAWIGFQEQYTDPRIILVSDYSADRVEWPADKAGLATGDFIVMVNGKKIDRFQELRQQLVFKPEKAIPLAVNRNGKQFETHVIPRLDKNQGRALIGIMNWIDPVISEVDAESVAGKLGIHVGDRIIAMGNNRILHTVDYYHALQTADGMIQVDFIRDGRKLSVDLSVESGIDIGISFALKSGKSTQLGVLQSLHRGTLETWNLIESTLHGIRMMFMGTKLQNTVSGPLRLISLTGTTVSEGFESGLGPGFLRAFKLISLISVSLSILNLLPIPVLDGGQILLFLIEWIRRRPLKPLSIHRYQCVGAIIIFAIAIAATAGDLLFFQDR